MLMDIACKAKTKAVNNLKNSLSLKSVLTKDECRSTPVVYS